MKQFSAIGFLLAFFLLAGCATGAGSKQVEIYRDGSKPAREYADIGILTDDGALAEQGEIEEQMVRKAQRRGADALIFEKLVSTGEELRGLGLSTTYLYKAHMVVYRK